MVQDSEKLSSRFQANKYVSRALYDVKGVLISSYFYGSESDLPPEVKNLVKTNYQIMLFF
jgi:hypothetical protein